MKIVALRAAPVLLFAAAAAAAAAPASDEVEEIPVGDLVLATGPAAGPVPHSISWPSPSGGGWYEIDTDEGFPSVRQPAVSREILPECIDALMGENPGGLLVHGDRLLVPKDRASGARAALARVRAQRPGPVDLEYVFETSPGDGRWKTLLSGREPILAGERKVFADARDRSYLGDFDVELAQASEIPDPIVHIQRTGALLSIRILPLPTGAVAVADVDAMVAEPLVLDPIMLPSHADMAPLDRAAIARDQACTVFLVEPGKASEQTWTGRDGRTLRLRLTARWSPPPADSGAGAVFWSPVHSGTLKTLRHVGYQMRPAGAEESEEWPRFGRRDDVPITSQERVRTPFPGEKAQWIEAPASGFTVLRGPSAARERDAFAEALRRELRSPRVEIVVRVATAGAKPEPASELFRASGGIALGLNACFLGTEARAYLQDADVEVAQASKIIDPVIGVLTIGTFCNVRTVPGPEGEPAFLDLDLQLSRLEAMEEALVPVERAAGGEVLTGTVNTDKGPKDITLMGPPKGPPPPKTHYRIEMPQCREVRIAGLYPLGPEGKVVLRRTASGFLGEGKEIVVEATVK